MFDDHPSIPQASVPSNLPLGEPPDIFEGTENAEPLAPAPASMAAIPPVSSSSSALTAGILTPKAPINVPPMNNIETPPVIMGSENTLKEPKLSHGIMVTIMTLVIACVLLGSAWFVYTLFTKKPADTAIIPLDTAPALNNSADLVSVSSTTSLDTVPTSSDAVDREIIVGEVADSDGDGLKDDREKELGIDPNNWDSDSDDLSDGEEILIWHTNPKNSDTDGDTYKDGAEIKSGYNPNGSGRLTEMSSISSSTVPVLITIVTSSTSTASSFGVAPISTSSVLSATSTSTSTLQVPGQIQL